MGPDPDAALMLAFQRGEEGAFRTLYERHARAMVAYCHHYVREPARAEELAQDVFVNVYRARDRYQASARFKTYLYRVASNLCQNELRRPERAARPARAAPGPEGGAPPELDALPSPAAGPEEVAHARALERAVQALLATLPEKQRAALVQARFEGLS